MNHNTRIKEMAAAGVLTLRTVETSAGPKLEARLQVGVSTWLARAHDAPGVLAALYARWQAAPPAPGCSSSKLGYDDEASADDAAADTTRTNLLYRPSVKTACRSYRCPECAQWHVTSRPLTPTAPTNATPSSTTKEHA